MPALSREAAPRPATRMSPNGPFLPLPHQVRDIVLNIFSGDFRQPPYRPERAPQKWRKSTSAAGYRDFEAYELAFGGAKNRFFALKNKF